MKVLIVGGGIAGMAHAAFLEKCGIEYDVVEKAPDFNHQGFLIILWDNGRDILKKLGLDAQFDAFGLRVQRYSIRDGKGTVLRNYSLASLYAEFGGAVTIIGRSEVHALLKSRVRDANIRMRTTVSALTEDAENIIATFSDGSTKNYDIVVGADGIHSTTRSILFQKDVESYTNWRAWYVWISNVFAVPATAVEYLETGEFIVTFSAGNKTLATMIAPAEHTAWDTQEGRVERLKQVFKDETHIVPTALNDVADADVLPTDLVNVEMCRVVSHRAALIGDAAHSFGPMAGLGTSMALEDAYVLAAELEKAHVGNQTIQSALLSYQSRMRPRVHTARSVSYNLWNMELTKSRLYMQLVKLFAPFTPDSLLSQDFRRLLKDEI